MRIAEFVFSPTGGTEKIADQITFALAKYFGSDLCGEVMAIDLTSNNRKEVVLATGDVAVVAVPVYNGRVPAPAMERIKQYNGNGAMAVAVAVYGNRAYEDALIELGDGLQQCGFTVVAGVSAVAQHCMVASVGAGRPDHDDLDTLDTFADAITSKIRNRCATLPDFPGNRPYKKRGPVLRPRFYKSLCGDCGKCVALCPTQAIDPETHGIKSSDMCIGCMRCVKVCPVGARELPPIRLALVGAVLRGKCSKRQAPRIFI